jgi:2-(1,2-epoxy-1,2-dihydrophenyl)acetyl-CoA isomerase
MAAAQLDVTAGVATVTLVDPDGVNALDDAYVASIRHAVAAADADPEVAVILVRAEGRAFCAGGDVSWFAEQADQVADGILGLAPDAIELIRLLHETPRPTIAAVHGAVAGAGVGIALACDLVIAEPHARLAMAYARIGASPDLGVSAFLVRDVGYRRAIELCLLGDVLDAEQAWALGLVNRVVPIAELDAEARALAARLARGPREANATAKRLLRTAADRPLVEHLADEMSSVAGLSRSADWREGVSAFLEHREPEFSRDGSPG